MSDIFREVEEDVRRERFEKLWKQYGDYVIAGVALIIIAIAAFELWSRYEDNQRLKASETLIEAQELAESGDYAQANPAFGTVAKDAPSGYSKIARLSEADALLASGRRAEAVQLYRQLATDDSGVLGQVALLRAAWAMADNTPRKDIETLLAPLTNAAGVWRHSAAEVLAYVDYHQGDLRAAAGEFQAIADDKDAPEPMRRRAEAMADFIKRGGLGNFGTMPPAPPPPPPGTQGGPVSGSADVTAPPTEAPAQ